jgi:hypothetical protein
LALLVHESARNENILRAVPGDPLHPAALAVLAFVEAFHRWEARMNARGRLEAGEFVWDRALREAVARLSYDEVMAEFAEIMRAHGRPGLAGERPSSWAAKGTFAGITAGELIVMNGDGGAVLVEGEMGQFEGQRFQFSVLRAGDRWQIAGVSSEGESGEWEAWRF